MYVVRCFPIQKHEKNLNLPLKYRMSSVHYSTLVLNYGFYKIVEIIRFKKKK